MHHNSIASYFSITHRVNGAMDVYNILPYRHYKNHNKNISSQNNKLCSRLFLLPPHSQTILLYSIKNIIHLLRRRNALFRNAFQIIRLYIFTSAFHMFSILCLLYVCMYMHIDAIQKAVCIC